MKMLQKWKIILSNWINCYSEEDTNKRDSVTSKSLVNIISHLRKNFNLDESTSSTLDAQTIQEFILEKYPGFCFENGNLEPKNEEEIYLSASLLLYFVCVNSKDLDIKKPMCSELSAGDQEIILKFSKSLMDCSDISSTDVLTAIAEACRQDTATANIGPTTVAETPPALRSLHGEVRRLQAALDAERFDRNYLQEELSRTNLKMEKLLKDKEQYKQDIANLKANLSMCGQDTSAQDAEASNNNLVKLVKQLEQTENRLITVQEALDEVQYERDMYKSKLDELKRERDKWIATSQEETSRACRLEDELETERKQVQSLRELVTELRQHNRLNGVDTSQLECDDLDSSVRSLYNASVCSEACANVIEVQLGEERAKIVVLEQQIKLLQDQLDDVMRKSEEETQNLTKIISEKDTDIFNLKHRINEEIEDKNNLKLHYEDEVTKLNNEVNELEQRIRGNGENSRRIIDSKMKEIQILQEEKLSLLQSMSDETAKLGNIIQKLTSDLDAEKTSKLKMKEDYESKVMKLNEKVLNRNNELVELQNKISENGEAIEKLQFDLRKEKESRGDLINKYNNDVTNLNMQIQAYEDSLRQRNFDIANLKEQLHEFNASNEQLQKERDNLRACFAKCKNEISILEDCKAQLVMTMQSRDSQIESLQKEKERIENEYTEEKERLQYNLDEINATVETLRNQLQNEIQFKIGIQNELHKCELSNQNLTETINNLNEQISTFKINCTEKEHALLLEREVVAELRETCKEIKTQVQELNKDKSENETMIQELTETVNTLNEQLTETKQRLVREKEINAELKKTCEDLNIKIEEMNKVIIEKETLIKNIKESLDEAKIKFDEKCAEKDKVIDVNNKLMSEVNDMEKKFSVLHKEKDDLGSNLKDMTNHNIDLQNEISRLTQKVKVHESTNDELKQIIDEKTKANDIIQQKYDSEIHILMTKLNVTDESLKELQTHSNNLIEAKELQIETLKMEIEKLQILLQQEREKSFSVEKENTALLQHINESNLLKSKYEKEYLNKCSLLNSVSTELNEEILRKDAIICDLKNRLEYSEKSNEDTIEEIKTLKNNLNQAIQSTEDITLRKNEEIEKLTEKIKQSEKELRAVIDNNKQVVEALQRDNVQLHYTIEEDNSTHKLLIKEKDAMIEGLETRLKNVSNSLNLIQKEYEADKFVWEKVKTELQEEINEKMMAITQLTNKVTAAGLKMRNLDASNNVLNKEKAELTAEINSLRNTCTESAHTCDKLKESLLEQTALKHALENEKQTLIFEKENLLQKIASQESAYRKILSEKDSLLNEKAILVQELMEEKSVRKIADEGKGALYAEKQQVDKKLREVEDVKNNLQQEKECLTQQLVEERHAKDLAEQEKKNIIDAKVKLEDDLAAQTVLMAEVEKKNVNLMQKIQNMGNEYAILANENSSLNTEKAKLSQSYSELKSTLDMVIMEKSDALEQISNFNKHMDAELTSNLEKIHNLVLKNKQLNADFSALKEDEQKLCTILNDGLSKVFENTNKDTTCKDILSKYDDASVCEKCDVVFKIINNLVSELTMKNNVEREALQKERTVVNELSEMVKQKDMLVTRLQEEVQTLEKTVTETKAELTKTKDTHNALLETKAKEIHHLQQDNQTLRNELNDVKIQLDVRVHSLKEKLLDNETVTDKLKCQIDNLNTMITKLTKYLKEKTTEIEALRNEKEKLQRALEDTNSAIKTLEEELKTEKQNKEKLMNDFESERLVLKNMVTVTESVMEDQKVSLNKIIDDHVRVNQNLEEEVNNLKRAVEMERKDAEIKLQDNGEAFKTVFIELTDIRKEKETIEKELTSEKESYEMKVTSLIDEISEKTRRIDVLTNENEEIRDKLIEQTKGMAALEEQNNEWKIKNDTIEADFGSKVKTLQEDLDAQYKKTNELELLLKSKETESEELLENINKLKVSIASLEQEKLIIEKEKSNICQTIVELKDALVQRSNESEVLLAQSRNEITELKTANEDLKTRIKYLEECLQSERQKLEANANEKVNTTNKCSILEEYQMKAEIELKERQKEICTLMDEVKALKSKMELELSERDGIIETLKKEKDAIINKFNKELVDQMECLEVKDSEIQALRRKLDEMKNNEETINILKNENEKLIKALGQRETNAVVSLESASSQQHRVLEHRDLQQQVDTTSTDYSSMESSKTITDLEKIIQDRNRTITTLQSDITYLKSLVAESENKYLDAAKDLEMSKENCHQLSSQLKKIVHQKNEEIADLKKQVTKMSVTENRASQIIKVSAKYQAIILKRIAEIKSNTVLKELTNFGNTNCDTDLRKSLTAGTITMEDLENFLETTERHIRRCSEKQIALQKERDRLSEINRIHESEIINIRKFLTELSVSIKTFNSVKELYTQKLSRVVSLQRTVRREILSLDGRITDAAMGSLERGYSAVMQDLFECAMNLERWIERCVSRTISSEKIKQAFSTEDERASLSSASFQNTGLEIQLEELQNSFQKLLEEVARAQKGEGAKDVQSVTIMEVRAEYEDKLNRMKAKMKQLYQEQVSMFKEKQNEEIIRLKSELKKTQSKLQECEEHIKSLTAELWSVGEKYIMKKDEADWLRKKQRSGSLMSLQHVHSSGLVPPVEERGRPSDTHSLRSLPANNNKNNNKEGRGLHMSDEEGEVFDNRWLRELNTTPRRDSEAPPGHRISELRYRNSLCPPHLKSSYPAETQFAPAVHEEDIKVSTQLNTTPRRDSEAPPGHRISELQYRNSLCPPHLKSSYPAETQFAPAVHEEDIKVSTQLNTTPRRDSEAPPGHRISELQYRNSLCPPHLKSSYPAETQFAPAVHEEDIKVSTQLNTTPRRDSEAPPGHCISELRYRNSLCPPHLKSSYPAETQFAPAVHEEDIKVSTQLNTTPRRDSEAPPGHRISELQYRNSLCPPHLKSSYPAETQFAPAVHEEDIKVSTQLNTTPRRDSEAPPGHRISELQYRNSLCPPHLKSSYPAETQFAPAVHEEDIKVSTQLNTTPRRDSEAPPGHCISELRYRNSLCPPHLKSSYPAETQFAPAVHEEDIKCSGSMSLGGKQRKEVGITAYKKPGPPTPSKQAGRLSATDSELRESLRIEADPSASRKTSTPSRLRALFRSNRNDTVEGTPRSRRLSNIFRKK